MRCALCFAFNSLHGSSIFIAIFNAHVMLTCLRAAAEIEFVRNTPFHNHSIESGAAFVGDTPFSDINFFQLETPFSDTSISQIQILFRDTILETHLFGVARFY